MFQSAHSACPTTGEKCPQSVFPKEQWRYNSTSAWWLVMLSPWMECSLSNCTCSVVCIVHTRTRRCAIMQFNIECAQSTNHVYRCWDARRSLESDCKRWKCMRIGSRQQPSLTCSVARAGWMCPTELYFCVHSPPTNWCTIWKKWCVWFPRACFKLHAPTAAASTQNQNTMIR